MDNATKNDGEIMEFEDANVLAQTRARMRSFYDLTHTKE